MKSKTLYFIAVLLMSCMVPLAAQEPFRVFPAPGAVVSQENIELKIDWQEQLLLSSVTLNGLEILPLSLVAPRRLIYRTSVLNPGENTLKLYYTREGQVQVFQTSFYYQPESGAGMQFDYSPHNILREGNKLEFKLQAPHGGKGWVQIKDILPRLDLKEYQPGIFTASYIIKSGDYVNNAPVQAYYQDYRGTVFPLKAARPVNIITSIFQVHILYPPSGEKVGRYFDIIGVTRPKARVTIGPSISWQSGGIQGPSQSQGGITETVDDNGNFKIHFGFPVKITGMKFYFVVFAIDEQGNRSLPYNFCVLVR